MYGHFRGMMQVIADFFQKEIVVFERPVDSVSMYPLIYHAKAYGRRAHGLSNGQILLVTDARREHYDLVTAINFQQLMFTGGDPLYDTGDYGAQDRYGWIDAPWMPPAPLPGGYRPVTIPLPIPRNDPLFVVSRARPEYNSFEGRDIALFHLDAHYGFGAYPLLPDPVAAGWLAETTPPPAPGAAVPMFPYAFGPHLITNGVYIGPGGFEYWPRWTNLKSYEAAMWQEEAKAHNILTTHQPGSQ